MVEDRLSELGIELPTPKKAVANYLGAKRSGDLLFVSARVSELRGEVGIAGQRSPGKRSSGKNRGGAPVYN